MTSPSPSPTLINSTRVGLPVSFVAPSDISYSSHSIASKFHLSTVGPPAALASTLPAVILPPFHQSASNLLGQHGPSESMASSTYIVYPGPRPTSNAAYQSLTPIIYPGTAAHAMSSIATDLVFASGTIGSTSPSGSPGIMPSKSAKAPSPAIVSSTENIDSIIATATSRVVVPTPSMATSSLPSGASLSSGFPTGVSSSASTTRPASRTPGWKVSLLVLCSFALLAL